MMSKRKSKSIRTYLKHPTAKPLKKTDETTKMVYNQLTSCAWDYMVLYDPYKCLNDMHKPLLILRYNMMKQDGV